MDIIKFWVMSNAQIAESITGCLRTAMDDITIYSLFYSIYLFITVKRKPEFRLRKPGFICKVRF